MFRRFLRLRSDGFAFHLGNLLLRKQTLSFAEWPDAFGN